MATRDDVIDALERVAGAYPAATFTEETVRVWSDMLTSLPTDVLELAVARTLEAGDRFPPGPGMVKSAGQSILRERDAKAQLGRVSTAPPDVSQAQRTHALVASVAAHLGSEDKADVAAQTYARIRRGAHEAGTADLPEWDPETAVRKYEERRGWGP
jgi:hypothetical protein